MKKFLFVAAAVAAVGFAAPASAQIAAGVGPAGVGVQVGPVGAGVGPAYGPRYGHDGYRDGYRSHRAYGYANCRTIRERIVRPSGRVIYSTKRVCG
jgi:hypothetical protein